MNYKHFLPSSLLRKMSQVGAEANVMVRVGAWQCEA